MDGSFPSERHTLDAFRTDGVSLAFRDRVDAFLDCALSDELRAAGRDTVGLKSSRQACQAWHRKLYEQGWAAPAWPVEHGGAGWTKAEQLYFETACAEQDAPLVHSSGIRTIGPLIMAIGTRAQKQSYLPRILSGEHEWCQGFSEPQAGSDLTALQLHAERDGDEFILNGSKIWTSFASDATHMFLLARCGVKSDERDGVVMLLVEMDRPGIEVRPIKFIDGHCETSQVFFTNVRTPVADRLGEIGGGWAAARTLMTIARSNNTTPGLLRRTLRAARRAASHARHDPALKTRLDRLEMRLDAFEALSSRKTSQSVGGTDRITSSMLKVVATELQQAMNEAAVSGAPNESGVLARYFANRAATIYSGTSEIHRNTMGRLIGL